MSLEKVTITNFLNLRYCTIEDLSPGLNVLVGKNGVGKTNIIRAIRFALCDNDNEWACPDVETFNSYVHNGNLDHFFVEVELRNTNQAFPDFELDQLVAFKRECRRSIYPDQPPFQNFEFDNQIVSREEYTSVLSFLPASSANPFVVARRETLLDLFTMDPRARLKCFEDYIGMKRDNYLNLPNLESMGACVDKIDSENVNCTLEMDELAEEVQQTKQIQQIEADRMELREKLNSVQDQELSAIRFTEMRRKLNLTKDQIRLFKAELETATERQKMVQTELQMANGILERRELKLEQLNEELCRLQKDISEMEFNLEDSKRLKSQLRAANDEYEISIGKLRDLVEKRKTLNFENVALYDKKKRLALCEMKFGLKQCRSQQQKDERVRSKLSERKEDLEVAMQKRILYQKIIDETKGFIKIIEEDVPPSTDDKLIKLQMEMRTISASMKNAENEKSSLQLSLKLLNEEQSQNGRVIVENDVLKRIIRSTMAEFEGGEYLGMLLDFVKCTPNFARAVEAVAEQQLFAHVVDTTKAAHFIRRNIKSKALTILDLEKLQVPRELMTTETDLLLDKIQYPPAMNAAVRAIFGSTYIVDSFDDALTLARRTKRNVVTPDGDMVDVSNGSLMMTGGYKDLEKCIIIQYLKYEEKVTRIRSDIEKAEAQFDTDRKLMGKLAEDIGRIQATIACRNPDAGRQLQVQQRYLREVEDKLAELEDNMHLKEVLLQYLQQESASGAIFNNDVTASELRKLKRETSAMESYIILKEISEQDLDVRKMHDKVVSVRNEIYKRLDSGFLFVDDCDVAALKKKKDEVERLLEQDPEGEEVSRLTDAKSRCENDLEETEEKLSLLKTNLYEELKEEALIISAMRSLTFQPDVDDDFENRKQAAKELSGLLEENLQTAAVAGLNANPSSVEKEEEMFRELGAVYGEITQYNMNVKTWENTLKMRKEKQLKDAEEAVKQVNEYFMEIFENVFPEQRDKNSKLIWSATMHMLIRKDVPGCLWDRAIGLGIEIKMGDVRYNRFDSLSRGQKAAIGFSLLAAVHRFDPAPYYLFEDFLCVIDTFFQTDEEITRHLLAISKKSQVIMTTRNRAILKGANAIYAVQHDKEQNCVSVKKLRK